METSEDELLETSTDHQPAPVSSTSSLDSLLAGNTSPPSVEMEQHAEEIVAAASIPTLPIQQERQQQNNSERGGTAAAVTPTSNGSSIISPAAAPVVAIGETSAAMPTLLLPPQNAPLTPKQPQPSLAGSVALSGLVAGSQAPEFLYQLTKMLTDDNRDTIEWNSGKIEVHSPHRLESDVLHKYFRHSKFASFQRQLNYFGFRKQAGKGKMAPCSYVNENLPSTDLSCLLHIKRKTSVSMSAKEKEKHAKKKEAKNASQQPVELASQVNPILAGILQRSSLSDTTSGAASTEEQTGSSNVAQQAVAQAAVGRGIRHGYGTPLGVPSLEPFLPEPGGSASGAVSGGATAALQRAAAEAAETTDANNPLSQLVTNYQNTLNDMVSADTLAEGASSTEQQEQTADNLLYAGGFLSRDDSLVDLAMIPLVNTSETSEEVVTQTKKDESTSDDDVGFSFIDFPNSDVYPLSSLPKSEGG